jgi:hypothetical protein
MAEFGVCVEPDGTIIVGDLDARTVTVTKEEIDSYVAGRTASQVESLINQRLTPHGCMVLVQSVTPLRFTLHNTTRVPSSEVRAKMGI